MTEQLELKETDRVLEIGTGSGFQAAVLAQLVKIVYTIEIYEQLMEQAKQLLTKLGFLNIHYKVGDGKAGWEAKAPFDKIIITALAQELPPRLVEQLQEGGKMILPLALVSEEQWLVLIRKLEGGKVEPQKLIRVRFVPLVSNALCF